MIRHYRNDDSEFSYIKIYEDNALTTIQKGTATATIYYEFKHNGLTLEIKRHGIVGNYRPVLREIYAMADQIIRRVK